MSPVPTLHEEVQVQTVPLLQSPATTADGRYDHWPAPSKPPLSGSPAKSGSVQSPVSHRTVSSRAFPYLVVSDVVISAHPLDLHWTQHPTHVINNLNISSRGLWITTTLIDTKPQSAQRRTFLSWSSLVACIRCSSCNVPSGISCDLHHSSILVILYWICIAERNESALVSCRIDLWAYLVSMMKSFVAWEDR